MSIGVTPNPSPNKEGHGGVMKKQVVMDLSTNQVLIWKQLSLGITLPTPSTTPQLVNYKLPEEAVYSQPKTDINLDHLRYVLGWQD